MIRFIETNDTLPKENVLEKKNKKNKKEKPVIEKTEEPVDITEFLKEEE